MNYKNIYDKLIEKAKVENINDEKYFECHHIIPKSLGGSDENSNLVNLTFRQHYIAHELLVKIYPESKKLIHALWMMTITTMNSIIKTDINDVDFRIRQRIEELKNDQKTMKYLSSYAYEKCKIIYKDMMYGHIVSEKTRKLISERTKAAMKNPETIKTVRESCAKGSKATKWYYDKETLKCYKQFPGDPDIDLEKYSYGRPSMSKEQREKLSVLKNRNRKCFHNDKFKLSYWLYEDYFKSFSEQSDWKRNRKEYKNNKFFSTIVYNIKSEMILNKNIFEYEKFFFKPPIFSKRRFLLNPGFFELCEPILINWTDNKNFKNDLINFLIKHKDEIEFYANKWLK